MAKINVKYKCNVGNEVIDLDDFYWSEGKTWDELTEDEKYRVTDSLTDMVMDNHPIDIEVRPV